MPPNTRQRRPCGNISNRGGKGAQQTVREAGACGAGSGRRNQEVHETETAKLASWRGRPRTPRTGSLKFISSRSGERRFSRRLNRARSVGWNVSQHKAQSYARMPASSSASLRMLLLVQRNQDSESGRLAGSTSFSKSATSVGSFCLVLHRRCRPTGNVKLCPQNPTTTSCFVEPAVLFLVSPPPASPTHEE
jgi:hypothetical protein